MLSGIDYGSFGNENSYAPLSMALDWNANLPISLAAMRLSHENADVEFIQALHIPLNENFMPRIKRNLLIAGGAAGVLAAAALAVGLFFYLRPRPRAPGEFPAGRFTIGPATTLITGPLRADGSIDYTRAINEKLGKGVTPDKNAAVVLATVSGMYFYADDNNTRTLWALWGVPMEQKDLFEGYELYIKNQGGGAGETDSTPGDLFINGIPADTGKVLPWLDANKRTLDRMKAASELLFFYLPQIPRAPSDCLADMRLPAVGNVRTIADGLCCRALLSLSHKDYPAFESDLKAAWRWGKLMGHTSTFIERQIGQATEGQASYTCAAAIHMEDLPEPILADMADFLRGLPQTPPLADPFDSCERYQALDFAQSCARFGVEYTTTSLRLKPDPRATSNVHHIDFDRMLKVINADYDRMSAAARMPTFALRQTALIAVRDDVEARKKKFENAAEKSADLAGFLVVDRLPILNYAFEIETRHRQYVDLVELAIALERYRHKHGEYPADLNALRGEFLSVIPQDRYIDAPLHYSATKTNFRLYSVGANMKDDGGIQKAGGMDDICIELQR